MLIFDQNNTSFLSSDNQSVRNGANAKCTFMIQFNVRFLCLLFISVFNLPSNKTFAYDQEECYQLVRAASYRSRPRLFFPRLNDQCFLRDPQGMITQFLP